MELYDLENDWAEQRNVVADYPDVAELLSDKLDDWKRSLPAAPSKNDLSKARKKLSKRNAR
ncbi:MAG: hypothetical protein ACR2NZ_02720 [Rubripirellula sp.]